MYWCLKCEQKHRENSMIGKWHDQMERPKLYEGTHKQSKPNDHAFVAGVALGLAIRRSESGAPITYTEYEKVFKNEGFDNYADPRNAINELRSTYRTVVFQRHSGDEWLTFETGNTNYERLKTVAHGYDTLGMSWGVRK